MAKNGAELIVAILNAYRVKHVFGVPGDTSLLLYDALWASQNSITHVMGRDERSSSFMADVYARLTGTPGVCEAPSGAGALYLVPGMAEATGSSIPLLALTTDIPIAFEGRNVLTEMNQAALCGSVAKWQSTLRHASKAPELFRKAFRMATSGRPGTVHITLPEDILAEDAGDLSIYAEKACCRYPAYRTAPDPAAVEEAAAMLVSARRPLIIAGGGVMISRAWKELTALAEALAIPVGTSINGKGSIDETHALSLGVVGGNGARHYANDKVAEADLVLFVGCKTDSVTTLNWSIPSNDGSVTVLQIDIDPAEIGNTYPTTVGLVGDARIALDQLLDCIQLLLITKSEDPPRQPWLDAGSLRHAWWKTQQPDFESNSRPIKPQRIFNILNQVLPRDSIIIADAGTSTPFTAAYYLSPAGRHVIIPRAYGGLGYAIPGVIGAKLAKPEAPVIGLMGDGSFAMSAGDLETIARLGLSLTLLQFNNASFGWIKELQHLYLEDRYLSVDFSADTDYAAIARGFGLKGICVEDPGELEPVLRRALRSDQATFIDVITAGEITETPPVHKWLKKEERRQKARTSN